MRPHPVPPAAPPTLPPTTLSGQKDLEALRLLATGRMERVLLANIIPVHSLGTDVDGGAFLVMKRIDGVAWSDLLEAAEHPAWNRLSVRDGDTRTAHHGVRSAVAGALHFALRLGQPRRARALPLVIAG